MKKLKNNILFEQIERGSSSTLQYENAEVAVELLLTASTACFNFSFHFWHFIASLDHIDFIPIITHISTYIFHLNTESSHY